MAFGLIPNSAAGLLAALAMIAGGCVRLDAIYRIISWKTVVLIAGMLPLATALTKTGRHGPDGQGARCGVGIVGDDRDAGGRVCGH